MVLLQIDYPDVQSCGRGTRAAMSLAYDGGDAAGRGHPQDEAGAGAGGLGARPELYLKSNRSSHSSDTSSAYSGSDTMHSVHSSLDADEVDLSGLVESVVDSDEEEDLAESIDVSDEYQSISICLQLCRVLLPANLVY